MSYSVEVLNLGKSPLADVDQSKETFVDKDSAVERHCWAVGEMAMRPGMTVLGTDRAMDVGEDGVMASARFAHDTQGGRVEVILRRRSD